MKRVADIRQEFRDRFRLQTIVKGDVPSQDTIEILNAQFVADDPVIFGKYNVDYVRRELDWYKSQYLNVNDIEDPIPQIWQKISDPDGFVNSNYGHLIWSGENGFQYQSCLEELIENPTGRQATMIYTRPTMYLDATANGMSDFVCTNTVNCFLRRGRLHYAVFMRSNDAVFGYKNDLAWHLFVQSLLCRDLTHAGIKVQPTPIVWHAASLHVYRRHFGEIK